MDSKAANTVWPEFEHIKTKHKPWTQPYKTKPLFWKSKATGREYDYHKYANHGYGGIKTVRQSNGTCIEYMDLPADGYPYTIVYEDPELYRPTWSLCDI